MLDSSICRKLEQPVLMPVPSPISDPFPERFSSAPQPLTSRHSRSSVAPLADALPGKSARFGEPGGAPPEPTGPLVLFVRQDYSGAVPVRLISFLLEQPKILFALP
jgi:hypothetical protein